MKSQKQLGSQLRNILSALCLLLVMAFTNPAMAQRAVKVNEDLLLHKWKAEWITCPDAPLKDYGVYHFRKSFELTGYPETFVINVSADNRYVLYVNGKEIARGPARGDKQNWYFETIDIAEHLKTGANVIAAVVWNYGNFSPLAQMSNATGLIVQGNNKASEQVNTNASWKVIKNEAYTAPVRKSPITVVGPPDVVDAEKYPFGWETGGYEDGNWKAPVSLGKGLPYGKSETWDWMLVPRKIPFMEHSKEDIGVVRRSEELLIDSLLFTKGNALRIGKNKRLKILIDRKQLTNAYPELIVSGGKHSIIQMSYAEALTDANGNKGNRNEVINRVLNGDGHDIFRPDGGQNRVFKPLWFRTYRYLELGIETKDQELVIEQLSAIFTGYPFKENARFKSEDPALDRIWETGWRTARLCAGETYYDCPYYEQLQYIGDTRIQSLISLYVSGDDLLMRNAIEQFQQSQIPEGLTQSRYPSSQAQVIPPFSLYWINMVHDYWMHRDDQAFVAKRLIGVGNILNWYEQQIDKTGMLGPMDWWNFTDWSFGPWSEKTPSGGVPQGAMNGNSSILTLQYAHTLQVAADLFEGCQKKEQAVNYRALASKLIKQTYDRCWDMKRGLISDTPEKLVFSEHSNIMGVLCGMFSPAKEKEVLKKMLADQDLVKATMYYRFYMFQAIKKAGMGDLYLSLLGPWKDMLAMGLTTFAETPEPSRSDCHAWSASPNYDLLATVCGIVPASPGFKMVKIAPQLGQLKTINAKMPHPEGEIQLNLTRKGKNGLQGTVILPEKLKGKFIWQEQELVLKGGVQQIDFAAK